MSDILPTKIISISDCGHDEFWLRDKIYEDPSILNLGDLQAVMKEKIQSQGGRLDLLLKNPEDDSMYEVELQLGPTDESHIVRTIEYWDNERKRWPNRSHTAVLVAEKVTSRFHNVTQLLSKSIPIIGIQVNVIQTGETLGLHFTKIIDVYEEPEEDDIPPRRAFDDKYWSTNYPKTLECVKWYIDILGKYYGEISIKYFETYISLIVYGIARIWLSKRKNDMTFIEIRLEEGTFEEVYEHLNKEGIQFLQRKYGLAFHANLNQLNEHSEVHEWVIQHLSSEKETDK